MKKINENKMSQWTSDLTSDLQHKTLRRALVENDLSKNQNTLHGRG